MDVAVQPGARGRRRHRLCHRRTRRRALPAGRGAARVLRSRARCCRADRHRQGFRAGRSQVHAAVRLLHRHRHLGNRARVPSGRGGLRLDRRRHRRRPHGPGVRRGRPTGVQCGRNSDDLSDGRTRPVHRRGGAMDRRTRLRRQPAHHPGVEGSRCRGASRHVRPLLSSLLAMRTAARLPGHLVVVRPGHGSFAIAWSS